MTVSSGIPIHKYSRAFNNVKGVNSALLKTPSFIGSAMGSLPPFSKPCLNPGFHDSGSCLRLPLLLKTAQKQS